MRELVHISEEDRVSISSPNMSGGPITFNIDEIDLLLQYIEESLKYDKLVSFTRHDDRKVEISPIDEVEGGIQIVVKGKGPREEVRSKLLFSREETEQLIEELSEIAQPQYESREDGGSICFVVCCILLMLLLLAGTQ